MKTKVKQEIDLDELVFEELLDDQNFKHLIKQQHNFDEKTSSLKVILSKHRLILCLNVNSLFHLSIWGKMLLFSMNQIIKIWILKNDNDVKNKNQKEK